MTQLPGADSVVPDRPAPTAAPAPPGAAPAGAFADWPGGPPWQPLPDAARRSFRVSALLLAGVISLAAGGGPLLVAAMDREPQLMLRGLASLMVAVLIFAFALWRASVAYRSTRWRLDEDGLRVRRGRWWRREILVPRARVQHLDIERGPIERRYGLATLIVHTAGTRMNALRQPGFDEDSAAWLRDALVPKVREVDLFEPAAEQADEWTGEAAGSLVSEAPASGAPAPGGPAEQADAAWTRAEPPTGAPSQT